MPASADLERDGDVALDLLGAQPVRLGDDLDHRRHRVRVGLDVETVVRVEAAAQEHQRRRDDQHRRIDGGANQPLGHWIMPERRMAPRVTTRSPGLIPRVIGTNTPPPSSATATGRRWNSRTPAPGGLTSTKATV